MTETPTERAARAHYVHQRVHYANWTMEHARQMWDSPTMAARNDTRNKLIASMAVAIAEYEAAAWQPIATAPKDGRNIWLTNACNIRIGFWDGNRWVDLARAEARGPRDLLFEPTHWQPVPKPPEPDAPQPRKEGA